MCRKYLVYIFSSFYLFSLSAMEQLSSDCIGLIGQQLVATIGTPNLLNRDDISVITKTIKALSLTNKHLYNTLNTYASTNLLLTTLSARFKITDIEAAAVHLKTPGAKHWLENYVKESGEYDLFKIVQKIFSIAKELNLEDQKQIINSNIDRHQFAFHGQIKRGLLLGIETQSCLLFTPWGELIIYQNGSETPLQFIAFTQKFFKRCRTTLHMIPSDFYNRNECYKLKTNIDQNVLTQKKSYQEYLEFYDRVVETISEDDARALLGTENLLIPIWSNRTIYKIKQIDEIVLPEAETCLPYDQKRSHEVVEALWKITNQLYQEELANNMQAI